MQRNSIIGLAGLLLAVATACNAQLNMDWAYHNAPGFDRATELVPGQGFTFLGNGNTSIPDAQPVTLYVLTVNQFAGDADEQVLARWWNGKEEKWIMGTWVTNVTLGSGWGEGGRFHGQPGDQSVFCDVWKIEIGADVTLPGENFYVIQLKGWKEGAEPMQAYLLKDASPESKANSLGQIWTAGNYFQHDWSVTILGEGVAAPAPAAAPPLAPAPAAAASTNAAPAAPLTP